MSMNGRHTASRQKAGALARVFRWCAVPVVSGTLHASLTVTSQAYQTNLFDNGKWVVVAETEDAGIPESPMDVRTNGVSRVQAKRVMFVHRSQKTGSYPQVAVVACSGFIRLKPGADPSPSLPFGTSVVLGPAFYDEHNDLYYNPQIAFLDILTSRLLPDGSGTLVLRMAGAIVHGGVPGGLSVSYDIELEEPTDLETGMKVVQSYQVTSPVFLNASRMTENQAFRIVQFSSMYLNETTHDSSGAKYTAADGRLRSLDFISAPTNTLLFAAPAALGDAWFDSVHRDNAGYQGNTPNLRVRIEDVLSAGRYVPQGYLSASASPANDNVSFWLHDSLAPAEFRIGDRGAVAYRLLARDNPFLNIAGLMAGADYGPFHAGQNPDLGIFPSVADLEDDMPALWKMAEVIRTYSSMNSLSNIARIAETSGLKVVQAAWLGSNEAANTNEVDSLIVLANQHSNVILAVAGSERVLCSDRGWPEPLPETNVLTHVWRLKQHVAVPVTVAEPWHIYRDHPALAEAVDLIFMNIHPYWEQQHVTNAVKFLAGKYGEIRALYPHKQVVISETGWPSAGQAYGLAVPSVSNQQLFAAEFLRWATTAKVDFCWFEAFDETWKTGEQNGVGTNWGLCFADRSPKHSVTSMLPDVAVTKVRDRDPVTAGTPVVYTVTVTNRSPAAAHAVSVDDLVPGGAAVAGTGVSAGSCTEQNGTIHWCMDLLPGGAAAVASVTTVLRRAGMYTNLVLAASAIRDRSTNDNAASVVSTATPAADSDGDGLPDWWEQRHFGDSTSGSPEADPDSDKMSNLQEYNAGTDPTNGASLLLISGLRVAPYRSILFTGVVERTYSLAATNNLCSPISWPVLQSNLAGRAGLMSFTDTNATVIRMYRVETSAP